MRNLWASYKDPIAIWTADISPIRNDLARVTQFLRQALEAGEENAVYTVQEAPLANYQRERDGPLAEFLEARFRATEELDLFHFASSRMLRLENGEFRVSARIAYYDLAGHLVEGEIEDFGLLLQSLRPADVGVSAGLMSHSQPVDIRGSRVDFRDSTRSTGTIRPNRLWLDFRIASDIWLPWVDGILEERYDPDRPYDNRPLAERHTPRLNRFLATVREATLAVGGTWTLDIDEVRRDRLRIIHDEGIRLDVLPPNGFMEYTP